MNPVKHIVANWKMNLDASEVKEFLQIFSQKIKHRKDTNSVSICLSTPFLYIPLVKDFFQHTNIQVGAQNCHQKQQGAFTGEVSAKMLRSVGADFVIIGHSERREYFKEGGQILKEKIDRVLENDMTVVFCVGEKLEERKKNETFEVIEKQMSESLFHLDDSFMKRVVIAYEPVWAIGTGLASTPKQAQEVHAFIRTVLQKKWNNNVAQHTSILYGGSCKPSNAKELFALQDVNGGLIGGASLDANEFYKIIELA